MGPEGRARTTAMNQHTIKILNYPDPLAEEAFVARAVSAFARARTWGEYAAASGLEGLLYQGDRPGCLSLMGKLRTRQILTTGAVEDVMWLAETCSKRITTLTDLEAPATRAKATMLNESALELHALALAIDEVLDLGEALRARALLPRS
jgi:hypothetical protein